MSVPIVIGAAGLSRIVLLYWFASIEKRVPDKAELNRIHYIYTTRMAAGWMGVPLLTDRYTGAGLFTMLIYTVAYGAFMSVIFKQKALESLVLKRNA